MSAFTLDQVAVQLYTLRDFCQTLPDFVETVRKVKAIGYRAVQISAVPLPYPEIRRVLDDAGVIACATHESGEQILAEPDAVCERLKTLGVADTAYPYPAKIDFGDEAAVRKLAQQLGAAGQAFARNGCRLSYHNHAIEFVRFGPATALDYLLETSGILAELDTFWVQVGGGNPVTWIEKLAGRQPLLHLKDCAGTADNKSVFCEVGSGNLDWDGILAAAGKAGVRWLIVEQDVCPGDPFVSVRKSFDFLKAKLGA